MDNRSYRVATVAQQKAAKQYGQSNGCSFRSGDGVYAGSSKTEWSNWSEFYAAHDRAILDELTRKYTRYKAFSTLCSARGAIKLPEATLKRSYYCTALADAYDQHMRQKGDKRRAVRE